MKKTMTAVVLLLVLTACGAGPSGTITEKEYDTKKGSRQECTGTGSKRKCKTVTTLDGCWELELDGETDVCVSKETYDRVKVGEFYQS